MGDLTKREQEIFYRLLRFGQSNKELADDLCVADVTIKAHLRSIFEKKGVRSRTELVARYARVAAILLVLATPAFATDYLSYTEPPQHVYYPYPWGLYSTAAEVATFTGWTNGYTIDEIATTNLSLYEWLDWQYPDFFDYEHGVLPYVTGDHQGLRYIIPTMTEGVDRHDGIEIIVGNFGFTLVVPVYGYRTDADGVVTAIQVDDPNSTSLDLEWWGLIRSNYIYVDQFPDSWIGRVVTIAQKPPDDILYPPADPPVVPMPGLLPPVESVPEPSALLLLALTIPCLTKPKIRLYL